MRIDRGEPTDAELRAQFAVLRERELAVVPEFDAVLAGATARATRSSCHAMARPAWAAAIGVAALTIAVWLVPGPRPTTVPPDALTLPGWRTPTDSLLVDTADPLQRTSWTALPTAVLGQPFLHPAPEIHR